MTNTDACLEDPYAYGCDQGNGGGGDGGGGGYQNCPPGQIFSNGKCQAECPPGYARNGSGQCVELFPGDDDPGTNGCGPNQEWSESQGRCVPKSATGTGGGGGGGGAAPKPAELNPNFSSQNIWDRTSPLWESLFSYTDQLTPRWNKDNTALVKGQLRMSTAGNAAAEKKQLMAQKAAAGTLKQGVNRNRLRGIDESANRQYASGATGIDVRAVGENFDDQMAILENKRQNVIQWGQFQLSLAGSDQAAASIRNSMAIALAQIKAQADNLAKQLAAQKELALLNIRAGMFGNAA